MSRVRLPSRWQIEDAVSTQRRYGELTTTCEPRILQKDVQTTTPSYITCSYLTPYHVTPHSYMHIQRILIHRWNGALCILTTTHPLLRRLYLTALALHELMDPLRHLQCLLAALVRERRVQGVFREVVAGDPGGARQLEPMVSARLAWRTTPKHCTSSARWLQRSKPCGFSLGTSSQREPCEPPISALEPQTPLQRRERRSEQGASKSICCVSQLLGPEKRNGPAPRGGSTAWGAKFTHPRGCLEI